MLVWFDGDVEKAFEVVATGEDELTRPADGGTGLDVTEEGPPPELLLDWRAERLLQHLRDECAEIREEDDSLFAAC